MQLSSATAYNFKKGKEAFNYIIRLKEMPNKSSITARVIKNIT